MTANELRSLLARVQSWPETAQDELAAVVNDIESDLQGRDYVASQDELKIIDAAMAAIECGETASDSEVAAVFARFRHA